MKMDSVPLPRLSPWRYAIVWGCRDGGACSTREAVVRHTAASLAQPRWGHVLKGVGFGATQGARAAAAAKIMQTVQYAQHSARSVAANGTAAARTLVVRSIHRPPPLSRSRCPPRRTCTHHTLPSRYPSTSCASTSIPTKASSPSSPLLARAGFTPSDWHAHGTPPPTPDGADRCACAPSRTTEYLRTERGAPRRARWSADRPCCCFRHAGRGVVAGRRW